MILCAIDSGAISIIIISTCEYLLTFIKLGFSILAYLNELVIPKDAALCLGNKVVIDFKVLSLEIFFSVLLNFNACYLLPFLFISTSGKWYLVIISFFLFKVCSALERYFHVLSLNAI